MRSTAESDIARQDHADVVAGERTRVLAPNLDGGDLALISACEAHVRDAMKLTDTPGVSVAVARGGRMIWSQAFGYADVRERRAMTVASTFPAGSMAKTFVAIAVLQLIEQGVLQLYEPARRYVPELPIANPLGEREITVYDLLTYRSGLAMDLGDESASLQPLEQYLKHCLSSGTRREYNNGAPRWVAKVGAAYHYSSLGMAILGYIVERLNPEGLSFADYVGRHVLDPVGLSKTGLHRDSTRGLPDPLVKLRCTGYARFGAVLLPSPALQPLATPASSLLTTPADFARLLLTISHGGTANGRQIIASETVRLMLTPQVAMDEGMDEPGDWRNGIGLELHRPDCAEFSFGHGGVQPWGWWNWAACFPNYDTVVAVFANRWDMPRFYNPDLECVPGLLVDFVRKWLSGHPPGARRAASQRSWSWRASWAIGFALAERTRGMLGAVGALGEPEVARLAREATTVTGGEPDSWDPDGFRAGASAMHTIPPSPASIRRYLESEAAPVTTADFPLLALLFGHRETLALPHPFFAGSHEEPSPHQLNTTLAPVGDAAADWFR